MTVRLRHSSICSTRGRGVVLDETVETVDTAATTLAALGLPALPHMRGTARLTFTR